MTNGEQEVTWNSQGDNNDYWLGSHAPTESPSAIADIARTNVSSEMMADQPINLDDDDLPDFADYARPLADVIDNPIDRNSGKHGSRGDVERSEI